MGFLAKAKSCLLESTRLREGRMDADLRSTCKVSIWIWVMRPPSSSSKWATCLWLRSISSGEPSHVEWDAVPPGKTPLLPVSKCAIKWGAQGNHSLEFGLWQVLWQPQLLEECASKQDVRESLSAYSIAFFRTGVRFSLLAPQLLCRRTWTSPWRP